VARRLAVIKFYVDKVSWDEAKSFLQYEAVSVVLKRGKTQFFQSPRRRLSPPQRFRVVFGLKRPRLAVRNLFFARTSPKLPSLPLFSIIGSGRRRQDVLPVLFFAVFLTRGLLSLPQSEIRAGKLLVDPGQLQEERVGGRPHHCHRRARRRRPVVDRALQKTHILLMTMAKITENNFLFQVMSPFAFLS
jgi:hypothetical protein